MTWSSYNTGADMQYGTLILLDRFQCSETDFSDDERISVIKDSTNEQISVFDPISVLIDRFQR